MTSVVLEHGAACEVGRVRRVNQDAFLAAPPVFVVADGMGGHDRGEVASSIVVEEFAHLADGGYDPRRGTAVIAATLQTCQDRIARYGAAQRARGAIGFHSGTTAVVALFVEDDGEPKWLLANIGDSRVYRWARGRLEQVSVDHSVVQEQVEAGVITAEAAAVHPERHVITRALGSAEGAEADYFLIPLASVERLLLCSDGVTGMIDDERIGRILGAATDPRAAAEAVVAAAVAAGGQDNATAVVIDVVGLGDENPPGSRPQRGSLEQKLGALQ